MFSLFRTVFLSSIFPLIFSLVRATSEKRKKPKKELNEELMSVVWHPKRWWDWCVSEDEKMEVDSVFIEEL